MPAQRIGEEYPAKSGFIITPKFNPSGRKVWRVDIPATRTGSQREQRQFKNRELACEYAETRSGELKREGHAAALLTATQRSDAVRAYEVLKSYGVGLFEAVTLAVKHLRPANSRISLGDLQAKFVAAPGCRHGRLVARRKLSSDTMRVRTAAFVRYAGPVMANEVSTGVIREWMASLGHLSPLTRNSYRLAVHAMFAFAINEGHCAENPVSKVKVFAVEQVTPSILTIEQAQRLVQKALETESELGLLAYVTLGLFAGLRRAEIQRLDWSAVKWERRMVTIDGSIAKTGSIRNVSLAENALLWLKLCLTKSGRVTPRNLNHRLRQLRFLAGIDRWAGNELRHSFASYHFDLHQNGPLTAAQLGHSSGCQLLFEHYRALVPLGDGERFFSIIPAQVIVDDKTLSDTKA